MKMLPRLFVFSFFVVCFLSFANKVFAVENPLSLPNNRFGIHILFPQELSDAAKLVNSNGGDWGYVTIPIQSGDKDLIKWQLFMDQARSFHIIPLIRLATEGDYFNTTVWRKPTEDDVVDFANFLNSLNWPTKNRYVIVYNEVNRGSEWGGRPNASEYAALLRFAVLTFKNRSSDFFIISAGMDNGAATVEGESENEYQFMQEMDEAIPGIFSEVDGIASHSYPNPGFSQPPTLTTSHSITSFRYESQLADVLAHKTLPIFITETGWPISSVSENTVSLYYQTAFSNVWDDQNIVAVTPFLLKAASDPFSVFSLFHSDGSTTLAYQTIQNLPKVKGSPSIASPIETPLFAQNMPLPTRTFQNSKDNGVASISLPPTLKTVLKWVLKM